MRTKNLEDVFKKSGIPDSTFVKPPKYGDILVSLRTKGRCLIVEGPSGIGKTTCVRKVLEELRIKGKFSMLSARKSEDRQKIDQLTQQANNGIVIIDDFHILPQESKDAIANYMKILADEERDNDKLILLGINKAGDSLIKLTPDLNNRIDTIKLVKSPEDKVRELISNGETALKIKIAAKEEIIRLSKGSFHIAQLLCNELCIYEDILEEQTTVKHLRVEANVILEKVIEEFKRIYNSLAQSFASGSRLRREGRAPYLHLLFWLSRSDDWTIQIDDIIRQHPKHKISVKQVVDKEFLSRLILHNPDISNVIHYDANARILTIEDPKFMFYLKNMYWEKFAKELGYINVALEYEYDFALSFAGEDRKLAEHIYDHLAYNQVAVFYDKNEQHRILAENVEEFLRPIYEKKARYVVPLLSTSYPQKIWTKFESDSFRERFEEGSIIPVWFSNTTKAMFDESLKYGGIRFNVDEDIKQEAINIAESLLQCLEEDKLTKGTSKVINTKYNSKEQKKTPAQKNKKQASVTKKKKNTPEKTTRKTTPSSRKPTKPPIQQGSLF
ncbi:TIR domain-containing protein [Chitinophaga flava]|uniref:ATPase n=1 Tax=Chitinophaga flava TaxID=2259036 RepID=A0A365Y0N6_9BACT|nr:TIR domain-containing protein [Chitinophaga flava]RBL92176.1 ATPase [Chitinophaga flava]